MDAFRSTGHRFEIGWRNTSLFSVLIFVLGFAVVSATIHPAYGINETDTPKSVLQENKDIQKPNEKTKKPLDTVETVILILTSLLVSSTYPVICAIYFKTLIRRKNEIDELLKRIMDKGTLIYENFTLKDLKGLFNLYHNWKDYLVPVIFNVLAVSFVAIALILKWNNRSLIKMFDEFPTVAIVAFAGAYIFIHYDMIGRFSTINLRPAIMYKSWLRLLIAGILGYLVSYTFTSYSLQLITAFAIGTIPFNRLPDLVQRMANLTVKNVPGDQPNLHKLQGLTEDVIDRLEEEGIITTQHLALFDPISLLLKTNFQWTIILDMINQAVLYVFIGDKIEQLRTFGIRSATEITNIRLLLNDGDENKRKTGEDLVKLIGAKIDQDPLGVRNLIESINSHPQVIKICNLLELTCER